MTLIDNTGHRPYIKAVAEELVRTLETKDRDYGASWKKRGGVGAFMNLVRKWDRLDESLQPSADQPNIARLGVAQNLPIAPYDIINAVLMDTRPEGVIDTLSDLAGYCLLILAEAEYQKIEVLGVPT